MALCILMLVPGGCCGHVSLSLHTDVSGAAVNLGWSVVRVKLMLLVVFDVLEWSARRIVGIVLET